MDSVASVDFIADSVARLKKLGSKFMDLKDNDVIVDGDNVYVRLYCYKEKKSYLLKAKCDNYPAELPDCVFVNPVTKIDDNPSYWPFDNDQGFKTKENPRWICIVGTREYKKRHQGKQIDPKDGLLQRVVFHIYKQMNK